MLEDMNAPPEATPAPAPAAETAGDPPDLQGDPTEPFDPKPMVPEAAEAARRAAFEAAIGGGRHTRRDEPEREDDDDGEVEPRPRAVKVDPPGKPAAKPDPKAETKAKPALVEAREREAVVRARQAMLRAGYQAAEIDAMEAADVIDRGSRLARSQQDSDILRRRIGSLEATVRKLTGGKGLPSDGTQTPPPSRDRLDAFLDEIDPEREPNDAPEDSEGSATQRPASELDSLRHQLVADRTSQAIDFITRDFPDVKDPDTLTALVETMDKLDPTGDKAMTGLEAVKQLAQDAAYIVFGPKLRQQAREQRSRESRAARNGQPDIASGTSPEAPRKVDPEAIRRAAYEASIKTNDLGAARRMMDRRLGRE